MMDWGRIGRVLSSRRAIETEVHDEFSFHIEGRVRELMADGWGEEEARAHVLERFGDVEAFAEACRSYDTQRAEREGWRMRMDGWLRDGRMALRTMQRQKGFTGVVVLTLALGIGATTAVFSVVEGVLLRSLPFPEPDRLAVVWQNDRATGTVRENASVADYYDYVERSETFDVLAMHGQGTAVLSRADADPLQLNSAVVTYNLADVLGFSMQVGRNFRPEEDVPEGPDVAILTDRLWRDAFGADPSVVGRTITIGEVGVEVVGILPSHVEYPAATTDVWMPIQQERLGASRQSHWVSVVGRLAPERSLEAAQAEMVAIMADLEFEYPEANTNRGAFVELMSDVGRGDVRLTLWVLFGAVLAVLAIACVNVANLLLARGAGRSRELALLAAVGASSRQITRRFFVEGLLITVASAGVGIAFAAVGVRTLSGLAPPSLLVLGEPSVNASVLGFTLVMSIAICLGFGFLPTIQARRIDLQTHLKDGRTADRAPTTLRLRRLLVGGQLALAVVLLLGASLLITTVQNLQAIDPGFQAQNSVRVDFALPASYAESMETYPDWPRVHQLVADMEGGVEAIPGVRSASVILNHSLDPGFTNSFRIEGQSYDPTHGEMTTRLVSPSYFETAGLTLASGRLLDDGDRADAPFAILLNETAASRYFPDGDALGQRIAFWGPWFREVVGIVKDERVHGLTAEVPPAMYVSLLQAPPRPGRVTLLARTEAPPLSIVEGIRGVVRGIDPSIPVFNVATMEDTLDQAMARERFASTVLTIFAGVALFLALLGVHGVLAYLVAQRGHEVGVRMALGATRRDVVGMVLRQGASMTAIGIVGGVIAALAASRLIQGLLHGVSATSPTTYVAVVAAMVLVSLAATALPARRAASVDPATSLRGE